MKIEGLNISARYRCHGLRLTCRDELFDECSS